jgi:hypothetical protein
MNYIRFYANSARRAELFHLNFLFHFIDLFVPTVCTVPYSTVHMRKHAHTVSPNRTEAPKCVSAHIPLGLGVLLGTYNVYLIVACPYLAAFASHSYRCAHY